MEKDYLSLKIGIIGGGQLGKMMIQAAKKLGFYITVLDPCPFAPASSIADKQITAEFDDRKAIEQLCNVSDIVTYEFEHIGADILVEMENKGAKIYPTAKSLILIQNKLVQKQLLKKNGINVPEFMEIKNKEDMKKAGDTFGFPFMLKNCTGGYDGKGNAIVGSFEEIEYTYKLLGDGVMPLMAEKLIDFTMETSVLACRGADKSIEVYPVGNNIHKDSILHITSVPADLSFETSKKAMDAAKKVMEVFDGIGMFCIEMFIEKNGNVLINEVAPRPHNSGHYSIEGCKTSQFENHIRAICSLPLGSTKLLSPVAMINLLGDENSEGEAFVSGLYEALKVEGAKVHIYGKKISKPKRKMGHITVTSESADDAVQKALKAYEKIKITGKN